MEFQRIQTSSKEKKSMLWHSANHQNVSSSSGKSSAWTLIANNWWTKLQWKRLQL
jgi:hypothetical protein